MTTLTSAVLALHPDCCVLNHAGIRVFENNKIDFLKSYSKEKFAEFMKFALEASKGGERGLFGGSIFYSHAFDDEKMKEAHLKSAANLEGLGDPRIIIWKESLRTAQHIRKHRADLQYLISENPQVKFLLPVRNPIDCAISHIEKEYWKDYEDFKSPPSVEQMLEVVLREFHWSFKIRDSLPNNFFTFFEHQMSNPHKLLCSLASFLNISVEEAWLAESSQLFRVKKKTRDDNAYLDSYFKLVKKIFSENLLDQESFFQVVESK